jgi:tetratricopeptide (TPR) repeat protein
VAYYFAREREDQVLEVQALGPDSRPCGPVTEFSLDGFLKTFMPEPQMSQEHAKAEAGRQGEILKSVARGDKFLQQGKTFSAEFEYGKALTLDEQCVRANFGIGLCYIERGEADKAREVLERLVKLDAAFQDEHKHLFNEFGISLRKASMHAEALAYYARAVDLCPNDENLHYNMARASFDLGDSMATSLRLTHCLTLNPDHVEARQFLDFLKRKQGNPG